MTQIDTLPKTWYVGPVGYLNIEALGRTYADACEQHLGRYKDLQWIGGRTGTAQIFRALVSGINNDQPVALQVEPQLPGPQYLEWEAHALHNLAGAPGFPKVFWFDLDYELGSHVMLSSLLGPSLEELRTKSSKIPLETTLNVIDQLIVGFEHLHNRSYLHGNVQPGCFVMGTGINQNTAYIFERAWSTEIDGDVPASRLRVVGTSLLGFCGCRLLSFSRDHKVLVAHHSGRADDSRFYRRSDANLNIWLGSH